MFHLKDASWRKYQILPEGEISFRFQLDAALKMCFYTVKVHGDQAFGKCFARGAGWLGTSCKEGLRSNSRSKPKVQSVGYSHCILSVLTESGSLATKEENLPNLVTLWELHQHHVCPSAFQLLPWCRLDFSLLSWRGINPWKKLSLFKWVKQLLFQVHVFHCYFLVVTLLSVFYSIGDVMFTSDTFLAPRMNC